MHTDLMEEGGATAVAELKKDAQLEPSEMPKPSRPSGRTPPGLPPEIETSKLK